MWAAPTSCGRSSNRKSSVQPNKHRFSNTSAATGSPVAARIVPATTATQSHGGTAKKSCSDRIAGAPTEICGSRQTSSFDWIIARVLTGVTGSLPVLAIVLRRVLSHRHHDAHDARSAGAALERFGELGIPWLRVRQTESRSRFPAGKGRGWSGTTQPRCLASVLADFFPFRRV